MHQSCKLGIQTLSRATQRKMESRGGTLHCPSNAKIIAQQQQQQSLAVLVRTVVCLTWLSWHRPVVAPRCPGYSQSRDVFLLLLYCPTRESNMRTCTIGREGRTHPCEVGAHAPAVQRCNQGKARPFSKAGDVSNVATSTNGNLQKRNYIPTESPSASHSPVTVSMTAWGRASLDG